MRDALGIDVGSTTAKVVVVDAAGALVWHRCERHRGRAREAMTALVDEARARFPVDRVGCTGSLGIPLGETTGATMIHEVGAVVLAVRERLAGVRTIVELGGQDAKIVQLGATSAEDDARMNDRCAAGTGATLDRIAHRLELSAAEIRAARPVADLRVAAKCGVFAETDVVNLVKAGAAPTAAFGALARAIVVQNLAVLARGRVLRAPVALLGGPHVHVPALAAAWAELLAELWQERDVEPGPVDVPSHGELFAAIGAALHAARGGRHLAVVRGALGGARTLPPLLETPEDAAVVGRFRTTAAKADWRPGAMRVALGIDAGSTTAKAVLLDASGAIVASSYAASGGNPVDDARARLAELEARATRAGVHLDVASVGVTGYGAALVSAALGADAEPVETVAHARAALVASPGVEVVVDVGGTDVKVLRLDGSRIAEFHVSNHCAAGHGAFVAAVAADMGVPVDDIGARALAARRAPRFAVGCAVFMDTDRVTFQRDGFTTDELLAGLCWSVARSVWEFVVPVPPARLGTRFLLTGGAQRNVGVAWAQARYLREHVPGAQVDVHPAPELCGAIGAALAGAAAAAGRPTRFIGLARAPELHVAVATGAETRCTRCEIHCQRSVLSLTGAAGDLRTLVVGNACERGADVASQSRRAAAHAPDLFDAESRRLFARLLPSSSFDGAPATRLPVIAVPRVMGLYRCAPLLLHYLRAAGLPDDRVLLSPPTSAPLFESGARWSATDPCFPAKLVPAHVDWVMCLHRVHPVDCLFLPMITHAAIDPYGVTDTASCPIVAGCGHTTVAALKRDGDVLGRLGIRALTPELDLARPERLDGQLFDTFGPLLGIGSVRHRAALEHGRAAQRAFFARAQRNGRRALDDAALRGRATAVLLARPYHVDPGVQHGVSTELAARGVPVLSISSLPRDDRTLLDLSGALPGVTNSGGAEKLWAARAVAANPALLAVELSSFRCGQDASAYGAISDVLAAADKPFLALHDLDEDRPAVSLRVRIETFVDAVRRYEAEKLGLRREAS